MADQVGVRCRARCLRLIRAARLREPSRARAPDRAVVPDDSTARPLVARIRERRRRVRVSPHRRPRRRRVRAVRNGRSSRGRDHGRMPVHDRSRRFSDRSSSARRLPSRVRKWLRGRNLSSSGRKWPQDLNFNGLSHRWRHGPSRSSSGQPRRRRGPKWRRVHKWLRDPRQWPVRHHRHGRHRRRARVPSLRAEVGQTKQAPPIGGALP